MRIVRYWHVERREPFERLFTSPGHLPRPGWRQCPRRICAKWRPHHSRLRPRCISLCLFKSRQGSRNEVSTTPVPLKWDASKVRKTADTCIGADDEPLRPRRPSHRRRRCDDIDRHQSIQLAECVKGRQARRLKRRIFRA